MSRSCVLHVDDGVDDRLLVRHASKHAEFGLPLFSVETGNEAMAYLAGEGEYADRTKFPLPCVVLLDVKMPGVTGFEVLQWVRNQPQFRKLVVIMFSASSL